MFEVGFVFGFITAIIGWLGIKWIVTKAPWQPEYEHAEKESGGIIMDEEDNENVEVSKP